MQITLRHRSEILLSFEKVQVLPGGKKKRGTQVPPSKRVQCNYSSQSFSQWCLLHIGLVWVFFSLSQLCSSKVKQQYWISDVRTPNQSLDGLVQKQVWEKCLLVLVSPSSGAWLWSRRLNINVLAAGWWGSASVYFLAESTWEMAVTDLQQNREKWDKTKRMMRII